MGDRKVAGVVLAAGQGKRLHSETPKVLHRAAGRPLAGHVLAALAPLSLEPLIVVVPAGPNDVAASLAADGFSDVVYVVQEQPLGTGDAVRAAAGRFGGATDVLIVNGDAPLIRPETLARLLEAHAGAAAAATVAIAELDDPSGYGRIVRAVDDSVDAIVEERDASEAQRRIREVNAGIYLFDAVQLAAVLDRIEPANAQGEYYLTDVVSLLRSGGRSVIGFGIDAEEMSGVNDRSQLAAVMHSLRQRTNATCMTAGVTIVDPATTYIDATVEIEPDVIVHPFTFLEGRTTIARGAVVGPNARVVDSVLEGDAEVAFSVVRGSRVGRGARVGPYASLRPGTVLAAGAHIGTFVETKNSTLGEGSKAPHLSYLGDAEIGSGVNIGAGTITCNWDGVEKHATVIEDDAYIASDTMLVAPVKIGRRAATGAGAVVRDDVPDDALAVGMPARVIQGKGDKMRKAVPHDGDEEQPPRR
ncbi:MAG: bifunctional UDP-N-acetylglucosamine diphosphorylase/glucosamine-1-phosphate N-acetyltransferase GlmU [Actinomycetota bacterium]|nr:bifunctional UDP-N-acetylglucosamine diphosphorylase/glucosamine-1-phosphate N-acetyltransferase GlmU [Actinomycetota bacterium]